MTNWKTIAIVLAIVVILETLYLIYIYWAGYEYTINKEKCAAACAMKNYISFYYEYYTRFCYCYDKEGNRYIINMT